MTLLQYPGHFTAVLVLVMVTALFVLAFRTEQWRQLRLIKWVLPVLQFLPILLLVVLLWDPARPLTRPEERLNTVAVVFDISESMSIADVGGSKRLDDAILAFEAAFNPGESGRPQFIYLGFDGALHEAATPRALPRWGFRTSVAPLIELLERYAAPTSDSDQGDVVGAIVFTDGQTIERNALAVPEWNRQGFETLLVGVGSDESHVDVVIEDLVAPPRVRLDAPATVTVTISGSPPAEAGIHLELSKDGLPFAARDLSGEEVAKGVSVDFRVPADTLGVHTLDARATTDISEITLANNARQTTFEVVDEPKLRVLLYSQWANFDIGKLRQVLDAEKKVSLNFVLDALLDAPDQGRGPYRAPQPERKFPADAETLYEYDVIVLGPCDPRSFTSVQLEGLYGFVAERGGGLLLIPGQDDFDLALSHEPKLRALMPGIFSPGGGMLAHPATAVEITPEGLSLGLAPLNAGSEHSVELSAYYDVEKKPAATTAVTLQVAPALVSHRVGRGNVALLNLRHLYRLYREDEEGGPLRSLASGLVTHLGAAVREESRIHLLAERMDSDPRMVQFTAVVRDALYKPASGASVLLSVDDKVTRMDEAKSGEYRAMVRTDGQETLIARAEAAQDGLFVGETTIAARLPLPQGEMDLVQRNRPYLEALAKRLNAQYVDMEQLGPDEVERFPAYSRIDRVADMQSAWRNWLWFGALCALLTTAWFVRRLAGMV